MQNEIGKKDILINIWIYSNFFPEFIRKIVAIQDKCVRVALNDCGNISWTATKPWQHTWMWIDHLNWHPNFYTASNNLNPLFMKEIFNCSQCIANDHCLCKSTVELTLCYYHVMILSCHIGFQSESTFCSYLNVKELLAWNRRDIWNLSDSNRIRTHNHLLCKQTLNHLVFFYKLSGGCGFKSRCCRGRVAFGKKIFCRTVKPKFWIAMPQRVKFWRVNFFEIWKPVLISSI